MSRIRILTEEDAAGIPTWLAHTGDRLGAALDASGRGVSFADTNGQSVTVPLTRTDVIGAVAAALVNSERRVWAFDAFLVARALAMATGQAIETFDWVLDVDTLQAVLQPGHERPAQKGAAHAVAGRAAKAVEEAAAATQSALRQSAMVSVRQEQLWRTRRAAGIRVDVPLLRSETARVFQERTAMRRTNRIDLTVDSDAVLAWVAAHGITLLDREGQPTLSHDHFDRASVESGSEQHWQAFRAARSLTRSIGKLGELSSHMVGERLYPRIVVRHAKTGRGSFLRPALQNMQSGLRRVIVPADGHRLVSLDLDRAEVVTAAALSGDAELAAALREGDPYLRLAQENAAGVDVAAERAEYKRAMIAALYGQGFSSLAAALGKTEAEARAIRTKLRERWPVVFAWIDANTAAAKAGVVQLTIGGRLTPTLTADRAFTRTNHLVQGSAADLLYGGVARVVDRLDALALKGRACLLLTVHDEVVLEVPAGRAEAAREALEEGMRVELPGGLVLRGDAQVLAGAWSK